MSETTWDKDSWDCLNYEIPYPIYFYFLDSALWQGGETSNSAILGNCPSLLSVHYSPFIERSDLDIAFINYDVDRFGAINPASPSLDFTPTVARITAITNNEKTLGFFDPYPTKPTYDKNSVRSANNESRLYNFPYRYGLLTDNISTPLEVYFHLCQNYPSVVNVRNTISDRCSYGLYIQGYKNDYEGAMEGMVNADSNELPCSSSAYSQWFATSKNQTQQATQQALQQSLFSQKSNIQLSAYDDLSNAITGTLGGLTSIAHGSLGGGLMNGASVGLGFGRGQMARNQMRQQGSLDRSGIIGQKMAQQRDLNNTPKTMISMGSNIIYGLDKGNKKVQLYRYGLQSTYAQRLGDYFAMFGYKQNKIMTLGNHINDRYYYNYIKTIDCNIANNIAPKEHLETMRKIFDNGVTIWHVSREGVEVGNYYYENAEV